MTPADEFDKFFLEWLADKYTPIEKIKTVSVVRSPSEFDLKTDLYIRNDVKEEILRKLKARGYLSY